MDKHKILEIIIQNCIIKDNKKYLPCSIAFQMAKELNESISTIGELCNKEKIKIKACQLSCF